MSNVKTYPRYEVNVKDNSIYNLNADIPLPVHRALWVLPTQSGPEGEPIWIRDIPHFQRVFGKDTLELYSSKFQCVTSYWLRQLLDMNGQFIVRAVDDKCARAAVVLYAKVTTMNVCKIKGEYDISGNLLAPYKVADDVTERLQSGAIISAATDANLINSVDYDKYAVELSNVQVIVKRFFYDKDGLYIGSYLYTDENYNNTHERDATYIAGQGAANVASSELKYFHICTPVTEQGLKITFVAKPATTAQLKDIENNEIIEADFGTNSGSDDDGPYTEFPILVVAANYVGSYGNDLAFRFFSKPTNNTAESVQFYKTVFNTFGAFKRDTNMTSTSAITSQYGQNTVEVSADPSAIDPETSTAKGMEAILESNYDSNGEYSDELPFMIFSFEENLKAIGEKIASIEGWNPGSLGFTDLGYTTYQEVEDAFGAGELTGYMIDVLGGLNAKGNPYPHVMYGGNYYPTGDFTVVYSGNLADKLLSNDSLNQVCVCPPTLTANGGVTLDDSTDIFLTGGSDGKIWDSNGVVSREFMDQAMYDFVTLKTNPKIVDKFRYPITHIYDIGYSMPTKYAMIDFVGVIRDDVMLELTTQVILDSRWLNGLSRPFKINDMQTDITNGVVLRERALLTKESIINDTDAMRCAIYGQAGQPTDVSWYDTNNKLITYKPTSILPFVFWSAYQHAQYENTPVMSTQEPRGLPYSYNELFKAWAWMPYSEQQRELAWNRGVNYCQYADMSRIFYPALRTVYRAETSVLVDQWDVDCLVYLKHECRRAWAQFVGRNDRVAVLQSGIKEYLEKRLQTLLNGKYDFTVEVYQTEEEQKIGFIQHVRITLTFPATLRQIVFDIEVNREGYTPEQ